VRLAEQPCWLLVCFAASVEAGASSQPSPAARGCSRHSQVLSGQTLPVDTSYQHFVQETGENWPIFSMASKKK